MINNGRERTQSTLGGATQRHMVLCCVRKQDEQVMKKKPVSRTPPQSLFQFLLQDSHLVFLPQVSSVMVCGLKVQRQNKPFPLLSWFWSHHSSRKQTRTLPYQEKIFILAHGIGGFSFWQYVAFILTCGNIHNVFW